MPFAVISATLKNLSGSAFLDAVSIRRHAVASIPCVYPTVTHSWRLSIMQETLGALIGVCAGSRSSSVNVLIPVSRSIVIELYEPCAFRCAASCCRRSA